MTRCDDCGRQTELINRRCAACDDLRQRKQLEPARPVDGGEREENESQS